MAGLVLDDFLCAIQDMRRDFKLRKPTVGLEQIEHEPIAKKALNEIIEATKKRHGINIFSNRHPLLDELGPEIYAEETSNPLVSGYCRISHSHVDRTLRRVFETALQTLVQLPARDPKGQRTKDKLVGLSSRYIKLADQADTTLRGDRRISLFFEGTELSDKIRLRGLPAELRWGAKALRAIVSGTRKVKIITDSPNPQVRFALYLAAWIEACTGRKHYSDLGTLALTAFTASGMRGEPQWVHRLEIEMNRKMKKRRAWAKLLRPSH